MVDARRPSGNDRNSLFGPLLSDDLLELVKRTPRTVGIFAVCGNPPAGYQVVRKDYTVNLVNSQVVPSY